MIYNKKSLGAIALYPNKDKLHAFIAKIKNIIQESQNLTAIELINKLNPIIRG